MTMRPMVFDGPFLLGFDQTRLLVERAAKAASEAYPPYNVESLAGGGLLITVAVAGFTADQIDVQVEGRQLTILGRRDPPGESVERDFLHRGIASRGFQRSFVLASGMEVTQARLDHGLLYVEIAGPEEVSPRRSIPITTVRP